jgi:phosphoglycolate phosphatase-like HAD superfamily hydrolase
MRAAGEKAGAALRVQARQEVVDAAAAMAKRGLTVHRPNAEQMKEWQSLADKLYPRIRGTMVPADTFDEVMAHLKTYRANPTRS